MCTGQISYCLFFFMRGFCLWTLLFTDIVGSKIFLVNHNNLTCNPHCNVWMPLHWPTNKMNQMASASKWCQLFLSYICVDFNNLVPRWFLVDVWGQCTQMFAKMALPWIRRIGKIFWFKIMRRMNKNNNNDVHDKSFFLNCNIPLKIILVNLI